MKKMSVLQFKRFIEDNVFNNFSINSSNQENDIYKSMHFNFSFSDIHVTLNPEIIIISGDLGYMYFDSIDHIDVHEDSSNLKKVFEIVCLEGNNKTRSMLIAS